MNDSFSLPKKLVTPLSIGIEVTPKCNLRCSYCCVGYNYDYDALNVSDIVNIIDECNKIGVKLIEITGGEPFLREDIFKILESINKNIIFTIKSNGIFISKEISAKLKKFNNLRGIGVSIDSNISEINSLTRGCGTFEKTFLGLKNLKKSNINFGIMTTVNKHNYDHLSEMVKFAEDIGAQSISFNRPMYIGKGSSSEAFDLTIDELKKIVQTLNYLHKKHKNKVDIGEWSLLVDLYKLKNKIDTDNFIDNISWKNGCTLGFSNLFIKYNGDITACPFLEKPICGNVLKNTLTEIWKNSEILNNIREKTNVLNTCHKKCKYSAICVPGCGIYRESINEKAKKDKLFCLNY
ncbi:MAG: radical SAM protein [Streptococcaceae bacterium]|jgi:radical SAM protein with 4Fe4S-binding SPASM domain|nr:radical SAM protein [Streptococcaceae bacterium]